MKQTDIVCGQVVIMKKDLTRELCELCASKCAAYFWFLPEIPGEPKIATHI